MPNVTGHDRGLRHLRPLAVLGLALAFACSPEQISEVPVAVQSIHVSETSLSLVDGETHQLSAIPMSASGNQLTARAVQWSSSNVAVVSVTGSGQATGVGAGSATVTARAGDAQAQVTITVQSHLTVTGSGAGSGTVTGGGISCAINSGNAGGTCSQTFQDASSIVLTATPAGNSSFGGWSGGCTGSGTCSLTMAQSKQVAARFDIAPVIALSSTVVQFSATQGGANPAPQTVNVTNSGGGTLGGLALGTVQYSAGQPTGWLSASVNPTTAPAVLTLTASPGTLLPGTYSATVPVTSAVASNSPQTVAVTLHVVTVHTLTVDGAGAGTGTVSGGGIACTITSGVAAGTCSKNFADGTLVTLTATPTGNSTFAGWTRDCGGLTTTCNLTITADRNATAKFNALAPAVTTTPATNITGSAARLNGSVTQNEFPYLVWFEWDTDPTLGSASSSAPALGPGAPCAGAPQCSWFLDLSGLPSGTTFYYRIVSSDTAQTGTAKGAIVSFTTAAHTLTVSRGDRGRHRDRQRHELRAHGRKCVRYLFPVLRRCRHRHHAHRNAAGQLHVRGLERRLHRHRDDLPPDAVGGSRGHGELQPGRPPGDDGLDQCSHGDDSDAVGFDHRGRQCLSDMERHRHRPGVGGSAELPDREWARRTGRVFAVSCLSVADTARRGHHPHDVLLSHLGVERHRNHLWRHQELHDALRWMGGDVMRA